MRAATWMMTERSNHYIINGGCDGSGVDWLPHVPIATEGWGPNLNGYQSYDTDISAQGAGSWFMSNAQSVTGGSCLHFNSQSDKFSRWQLGTGGLIDTNPARSDLQFPTNYRFSMKIRFENTTGSSSFLLRKEALAGGGVDQTASRNGSVTGKWFTIGSDNFTDPTLRAPAGLRRLRIELFINPVGAADDLYVDDIHMQQMEPCEIAKADTVIADSRVLAPVWR